MKHYAVFSRYTCALTAAHSQATYAGTSKTKPRCVIFFVLFSLAMCYILAPTAQSQVQSTMACPAGHGYWDVLSVMMMDPGLAAGYHMEGITNGLPSSYVYTIWDQVQNKVFYVKNPQGNPWDINLYDSDYIYQWVTELQDWNGVNHWGDPTSCRKFNNGSQNNTADRSMRWAPRCAAPGGENSSFWNPPPRTQPNNTQYYTYVEHVLQDQAQDLSYSFLRIRHTSALTIADHRAIPPRWFSVTTLPLEYNYSCSVAQKINSCQSREVFEYGVDTNENPVDKIKHSYGWIRWRLYTNKTGGNPDVPAIWVLKNTSIANHLMLGQVTPNFQCF